MAVVDEAVMLIFDGCVGWWLLLGKQAIQRRQPVAATHVVDDVLEPGVRPLVTGGCLLGVEQPEEVLHDDL